MLELFRGGRVEGWRLTGGVDGVRVEDTVSRDCEEVEQAVYGCVRRRHSPAAAACGIVEAMQGVDLACRHETWQSLTRVKAETSGEDIFRVRKESMSAHCRNRQTGESEPVATGTGPMVSQDEQKAFNAIERHMQIESWFATSRKGHTEVRRSKEGHMYLGNVEYCTPGSEEPTVHLPLKYS